MIATLRRLDDGTRYYCLTWRQWAAALAAGSVLYAAVRFSPLSQRWTFTAVLLVLSAIAVAIVPLTGNALGLERYLAAIVRWRLGAQRYTLGDDVRGGVLLRTVPASTLTQTPQDRGAWWPSDDDPAAAYVEQGGRAR